MSPKRIELATSRLVVRPLTLLCRCCVNPDQIKRHFERACDVIFKNLFLGNEGPLGKKPKWSPEK